MKKKFSYHIARLIESTSKEGKDWEVVLIQAGKSLNRKFYPAEVLKKAKGLFEDVKAFAYEFKGKLFNHLPDSVRQVLPEGCIKNSIGWYDNVRFGTFKDENGRTQEGLLARLHISENAKWLRQYLKDAWEHGKKNLLGFSIDGGGDVSEAIINGEKVWRVNEIKNIDEVTVVTHPAAGGQPVRLLASKNFYEEEGTMEWLKKLYEFAKKFKESLIDGMNPEGITEDQEHTLIKSLIESEDFLNSKLVEVKEAIPFASDMTSRLLELVEKGEKTDAIQLMKQLKTKVDSYKPTPATGVSEEEKKKIAEAQKKEATARKIEEERKAKLDEIQKIKEEMQKMREDAAKAKCRAILEEVLASSDLIEAAKTKLRKEFDGKTFEKTQLEEAINDMKEILGKLTESGKINGNGHTKVDIVADEQEKLLYAFDLMFDENAPIPDKFKGKVEGFTSLKEAYRIAQPEDTKITGIVRRDSRVPRLRESTGSVFLREAITTSDFSYLLGTSMEKKLVRDYKVIPFIFAPIVTEIGIDNFKQQERIRLGGYSTLPTIADDAAYTDLYTPRDEKATYTASKKGGYVSVSRNTIKNDDLGWVRKIPGKLAKAGKKSLERVVINLLLANGTYTVSNTTVFSTLFGNYSTNALSYDNLSLSRSRVRNQQERGTAQLAGTATSATSTTLEDTSESANIVDDAYNGEYLRIVYGTGAGQTRLISDTSSASSQITVSTAWTQTPSTDSKYEVSVASNDDEIIGLDAKYLIHGDATQSMVDGLMNSEKRPDVAEDEANRHKGKLIPIYVPQITGSTYQYYWFLAVSRDQADIIEIGYVDNQRVPLLMVQDQPALGQVFTNDRLRWKIRHEYGAEITDNAGIDANFAAAV